MARPVIQSSDKIRLCVMSDDMGMHPAINEATVRAFEEGLLTDSNLMPPCPAFNHACSLVRHHDIPVGLHATFTCDWDLYTWGPLTELSSMISPERTLKTSVAEAWVMADEEQAWLEINAQYNAIAVEGIHITHIGEHMGVDEANMFTRILARLAQEKKMPFKWHWREAHKSIRPAYQWTSQFESSAHSADLAATKAYVKERLFSLKPGYHIWNVHVGLDSTDLAAMCTPDFHAAHWAKTYRAIDFAILMDQEVKDWIAELGIEPVCIRECPTMGGL